MTAEYVALAEAAQMCDEQPPCEVCQAIAARREGAHSTWLRERLAEAWAEGVQAMTEAHGHACHEPWAAPVNPYHKLRKSPVQSTPTTPLVTRESAGSETDR